MSKAVVTYKNFGAPKENGEYYRLLCMTGRARGEVYILKGKRIVLGRSEEVDITVYDVKCSREHAEITNVGDEYILTDLGSQNGVFINDLKVAQYSLKEGDRIVIGKTVYKFGRIEVAKKNEGIELLHDEKEVKKVDPKKEETKKKKIILGIFLLSIVYIMFSDEEKVVEKRKKYRAKPQEITDDFSKILAKKNKEEDRQLERKLNVIFQRGLREAREGNYFRAISEFNLALILSPNNSRALHYKQKSTQLLDKEINDLFVQGRRYFDSLRFSTAAGSYCSIIRLIQNFPEDPRYKTAESNIREIERILGKDEGEIQCLKK